MKKTLLTAALAATLFTTGFNTVKDVTANASNKTLSTYMYQFKKVGKHVKLTKSTHIKTTKTLTRGKAVNYYGTKYYYSKQVHGYLTSADFNYKTKKTSKVVKHYDNNNTTNNTANTTSTNNSSNNDVIKNGFDETTSTVTDKNTYINVFTQNVLQNINNFRQSKNLQPLTLSSDLTKLANQRAEENYNLRNNYGNYETENGHSYDGHIYNGIALGAMDAYKLGLFTSYQDARNSLSENSGMSEITASANFENPVTTARNIVDEWINEGPSGDHYQNVTSHKNIGIGLYIGPNQGSNTEVGYAEDYTN